MSSVDSKTEGSTSWKLKEENAAHQLQIRRLRDTIMSGKQSSAEESLEQVMKSPMLQSLPLTEVTPALVKQAQDMESVDTSMHELMEDDKKAMSPPRPLTAS
ncbi:hypothetical protein DPEC_G00107220 [Dallia pectoralis]|uniref:Uncharacterized protein n=1 Tax=Dallia pectoralis TaxID=75939 RepID=A0ACC2GRP6_DALPE|nr:hypothetical protein DPEC_G00107220 [Dallia pectoralis]